VAGAGLGGSGVDAGIIVAGIEEGGLSFILFTVMVLAVFVALFFTIPR
jgi:hypothetical protein